LRIASMQCLDKPRAMGITGSFTDDQHDFFRLHQTKPHLKAAH
jgi:hypothetical protein